MLARRFAVVLIGFLLAGCVTEQLAPVPDSALKPRDKHLLESAPYLQYQPPQDWLPHIVPYSHKEEPGTVIVDTGAKSLSLAQPEGCAIRYGVTVGEEGMNCRGNAQVGRKTEWPE